LIRGDVALGGVTSVEDLIYNSHPFLSSSYYYISNKRQSQWRLSTTSKRRSPVRMTNNERESPTLLLYVHPSPFLRCPLTRQPTGPTAGAGEFPKSGDFPVESQVDRVVGIQDDMERKPEGAAVQEGHDNFDSYKPAGKVSSSLPFPLVFSR
jgi:hypothetical protein